MEDHSSTFSTLTSKNTSDITMLPELPPGSNERLRAPLVETDDLEVIISDEYEDLTYGTNGVFNNGTPDNDMVVEYDFV